jgi:transcriptional regulator with XRE-family HTH domain
MAKINTASRPPPFEVETALKEWGSRLRTARLVRNLSMDHAAAKLGVNRRVIAAVETGKPGTAAGVYVGLMWLYGLTSQLDELADPARDELALRSLRRRAHAYPTSKGALDNDF